MKKLLKRLEKKPQLYEQSLQNIWDDDYISSKMLTAHLDVNLDSATRKLAFVKKSVNWIANILPPEKYPTLLDLGCGPGIYAERFYQKGYQVSGIDLSNSSILFAQDSAANKHFDIHYTQGDYTKIKLNQNYHLITLIYCDFGVLSNQARKKLSLEIYNSLFSNGVFIFDVFTPLKHKNVHEMKDWQICKDGFWSKDLYLLLHSFYRYDEDNTVLDQYVVSTKNNISCYNVWQHNFTLEELRNDLIKIGFKDVKFFSNIIGNQYVASSDTICVLARK